MARRIRLKLDTLIPSNVDVEIMNIGGLLCYKRIGTRDFHINAMPAVVDVDVLMQERYTDPAGKTIDGYLLHYARDDGLYMAGCRALSFDEAIKHWTERRKIAHTTNNPRLMSRCILFLKAIRKHAKENGL